MCWSHVGRRLPAAAAPFLTCAFSGIFLLVWAAQPPAPGKMDAELDRQRQIIDRFVVVLQRSPRRGTALDKVYGFHVENGSLDEFLGKLRQRLASTPADGAGWMILGLLESQRSRDGAAVEAFTKAAELRTTDPLAAYYLGQSLVLVGQPEKAVTAFEEAIERKPAPTDMLEIFQALGRVHQRASRTQEALDVWNRLEKLFPGDTRYARRGGPACSGAAPIRSACQNNDRRLSRHGVSPRISGVESQAEPRKRGNRRPRAIAGQA
jgi:tetratricopeptide (TPR) repeat protein